MKTFVSNRVSSFEIIGSYQWMHVPSESNPADMISRGLHAKGIVSCDLWWNGPKLLQEEMQPLENCLGLNDISNFEKELKQMPDGNFLAFEKNIFLGNILNCKNNYMKLIKIFNFIFRFLRNSRKKPVD